MANPIVLGPGSRLLGQIIYILPQANSTRELQDIVRSYSFVHHGEMLVAYPSVLLRNGFRYVLPFARCRDPNCVKQGFTVRVWSEWWRRQGWHPPMHPSTRPDTYVPLPPLEETSFGPTF
jgi:hypothetical protein